MVGFQSMKGFEEQGRAFDGVEENAKLRQELVVDNNFEVHAECCKMFVNDDQESIKCFGGDVRPKTECLNKLIRTMYIAFHLYDPLAFFAVGPRYASGCGDTAAYPPHDSEAFLFEQLSGFSSGKNFFDDLTPPLAFINSMRYCLEHRFGAAEVFLVAVGIGSGFDYRM
jgi:hypothetical protein